MKRRPLILIGLIALLAIPCKTNAVEAIGNLGDVFDQFPSIGDIHGVFPGMTFANTFRTGAGSYTLDAVTLEHLLGGDPLALQHFRVRIYTEEYVSQEPGGFPDLILNLIGEVGNPIADPTPTQWPPGTCDCGFSTEYVKYTPFAPIVLTPNSVYWVAASEPAEGGEVAALLFSVGSSYTGLCDWTIGRSRVYDPEFVWDGATEDQKWGNSNPLKFKVEATPVNGELPHCNTPPDVSAAHASISTLWQPNGKMVAVHIEGVTDLDGDSVTIQIEAILQDELVITPNSDATTPDGSGIGSDTALVRAERLSTGNGRVYKILFIATDGKPNGYVFGGVFVMVPHDRGQQATAIDDGPDNRYYDSSGF